MMTTTQCYNYRIMKKILFLSTLMLAAMQAMGADVDLATAQQAAWQFAQGKAVKTGGRHMAPSTASHVQLIHAERNATNAGKNAYYIFNTDDSYIIVAGDDRAKDILAWGDKPLDMNNIPEAMQLWLDGYKQQMEYLQAHPGMVVEQGNKPATAGRVGDISPLLTALWDQGYPYYNQCPVSNGEYCLTGCPATSLSMVFYYWKYPTGPTPTIPGYWTSSLNLHLDALPSTTFDWDNMLDRYRGGYNTTQANAVAKLMRYVGQAEEMDYTPSASGSYGENILETVKLFGYDQDARIIYKSYWGGSDIYSDDQWAAIIQDELDARRPIVMCAYGPGMGGLSGHAFNIDGYDTDDDTYHINWGWSGSGNAYFALNAFRGGSTTYSMYQQLILGIEPPATVPTIKTNTTKVKMPGVVEKSSKSSFTVKGKLLTSGITLKLNDNSGAYSLSATSISRNEAAYGKTVTITYKPTAVGNHSATITLSSEGANDVTINVNGTARLETYNPILLEATDIKANSFKIGWNDATPAHNVDCYCVQMIPVEFSEVRLQDSWTGIESTSSNPQDMGKRLDEITAVDGWTGSKVFCGNGYLRLGNGNAKGWIETPAIDVHDGNGHITVKLHAKAAGADISSLLNITCGDNDTTVVITADVEEYCVMLPCDSYMPAKVRVGNVVSSKRVLLYDMEVLSGNDYTPLDYNKAVYYEGITEKSLELNNVKPMSYALSVKATYADGTESDWSNMVRVNINWATGDVNHDGEINIADVNATLDLIMGGHISASSVANNDVNGDGEVNIADVNAIIDRIMQ